MLDLDLTSPGHSRSKQMPPNERPYDFLSAIKNKFGRVCKGFQVTTLRNMPDLDLTFPDQHRSKLIVASERVYTSYPSSVISLIGRICQCMSSLVYATGHIKDPVPLIGKRRGLSPAGWFPPSFIHQAIIITGLDKLYKCMFSP